MHKRFLPSLLLGLIWLPSLTRGQSSGEAQLIRKLEARVEQLEAENVALRAELEQRQVATAQAAQSKMLQQQAEKERNTAGQLVERALAAFDQQMAHEIEMARNAKLMSRKMLAQQLEAFEVERAVLEDSRQIQIADLNHQLRKLEEEAEAIREGSATFSTAPAAVQAMARRMAEAQVENRLRMLEAEALVETLKMSRQKANKVNKDSQVKEELAIRKAQLLLEQRRKELEYLRQAMSAETKAPDRRQLEMEMLEAEAGIREAELMMQEAGLRLDGVNREIDERISEAAIQVSVSRIVTEAIEEEMAKLKELLAAGSDIDRLNAEKATLEERVLNLKLKASEEQQQLSAKMRELEIQLRRLKSAADTSSAPEGETEKQ